MKVSLPLYPTRLALGACSLAVLSACATKPDVAQTQDAMTPPRAAPEGARREALPQYHATYAWERAERFYGVQACPPTCRPPTPKTLALQVADVSPAVVAQPVASPQNLPAPSLPAAAPLASTLSVEHAPGRSVPSAQAIRSITEFAKSAKAQGHRLVVVGHADATGTAKENERIAVRRALTVKQELVRSGVPANLISVKAAPLEYQSSNATAEGRHLNRQTLVHAA